MKSWLLMRVIAGNFLIITTRNHIEINNLYDILSHLILKTLFNFITKLEYYIFFSSILRLHTFSDK